MTFPVLKTTRLDLVRIGSQYASRFFDIMSKEQVTKYYGMDSLVSQEEAEQIINSFQMGFELKRSIRWGLILKETGEFIGTIGLNNLNERAKKSEIGYELHPDYWRQGIAAEAIREVLQYSFEELDLFRMGAVTYPANEASSGLLKKLGFKEEGQLRAYLYQGGQSHDALVFSLLKDEWKQ